jgi:type IV pilus assembly protein PilA
MFCFRCGASMPDEAKVCPQCAAPVEVAPPPPPAQQPQAQASQQATSAWLNVPAAQAQYPQAQPYAQVPQYQQQSPTDGKATASLVCGILSILCFGILAGIPAIILGHVSRGNIQRSGGRLQGGGMAMAGLILGYASLVITALLIAAIMIPNLVKARITANESAAQSTIRTVNVSQVTYSTTYPEKGYASDLATLGPGQSNSCGSGGTAEHACLIDSTLGNYTCTAGSWCTKGQYKYSLSASRNCEDAGNSQGSGSANCSYVAVGTPVNPAAGRRSFCSTADGIVRQHYGVVAQPVSAEECSGWSVGGE